MEIDTVRQLQCVLRGHKVLVIGGDRREQALQRLQSAFGLSDIVHCRTRETDPSPRAFASQVHDPEIALVVLASGLSRTHHCKHLHRLCRKLGIPWIDSRRIPHPNTLADRISSLRLIGAIRLRIAQVSSASIDASTGSGGAS